MINLFKFFILFCISNYCFAGDNSSFILGAGDIQKDDDTNVNRDLLKLLKFSKVGNYKSYISFHDGNPETEQIINRYRTNLDYIGPFDRENFDKLHTILKEKLLNAKRGDKILLNVISHGDPQNKNMISHSIPLNGGTPLSLDELQETIRLATKAYDLGAKIAFIDHSCFSGLTQELFDEYSRSKICIISATGPFNFAWTSTDSTDVNESFFSDIFLSNLRPGINLEDLFLKALNESEDGVDFPIISTNEGQKIYHNLYDSILPFMQFNDSTIHNFKDIAENEKINSYLRLKANLFEINDYLEHLSIRNRFLYQEAYHSLVLNIEQYISMYSEYHRAYLKAAPIKNKVEIILKNDFSEIDKKFPGIDGINFMTNDQNEDRTLNSAQNEIKGRLTIDEKNALKQIKVLREKYSDTSDLSGKIITGIKTLYVQLYKKIKNQKTGPCSEFNL